VPDPVLVFDDAGVRTFALNRPHVRNAIDRATAVCLAEALDDFDSRAELVVGIITGEGDHFCSGMDLKAFVVEGVPIVPGRGFAGFVEQRPRKPMIAAVEGFALAGGFEIVLACDLVVAANEAIFGLPEVGRGLVAAAGGLLRLPKRVPYSVAVEMVLTGDPIRAVTAERYGLVNILTEPGRAREHATLLAKRIAANAPLAVAASTEILRESGSWPAEQAFTLQAAATEHVFASDDAREGAAAFAEKRAAHWSGR
jgi:enoyl-CoA hydratase